MTEPSLSAGLLAWAVGLLLPAAVLLSVLSALLERSGPIRLSHWAEEAGGRLRALYESPLAFGVFRSLLSLLSRLAPLLLFLSLFELLAALGRARPGTWALAVVAALLAATEVANRALVGHHPERALRLLTLGYRLLYVVLAPLVALIARLVPASALGRRDDDGEPDEVSDEEIEAFIDVGTREGILEPEAGKWLWSIVDFADTQVRSVMTPRIDMVCAPVDASLETLAERFVDSGHSRIPLFEGSIDKIVGVLHIRDVLRALRSEDPTPARELIKPPYFIPETKPLGELLRELQKRFQQLAIVVDEYGGTAGMVTVEDLLEEIVGEITDEHEALVAELEALPDGTFRLDGRGHIELLEDLFDVEIEEPDYETIGGLILSVLGRVPQEGESIEFEGLRFTVESIEERRIQTVRVERLAAEDEAQEA